MPKHKYAAVVVNRKTAATDKTFHYSIPEPLQDSLVLGSVVSIPFGRNNEMLEGVVVDFPDAPGLEVLKEICGPVSPMPLFTPRMLELSRWLADYYLCPWVSALQAMLPVGLPDGIGSRREKMPFCERVSYGRFGKSKDE